MRRFLHSLFLFIVSSLGVGLSAQTPRQELQVGEETAPLGGVAAVPLFITTDAEIEGVQMIFEWDGSKGVGVSLVAGAAIADADIVAMRVEPDHMLLGVVLDNDGSGNEVIEPGTDLVLGTANIRCGSQDGTFAITLVDGKYAMVGDDPKLDNLLVEGGLSIGVSEGLLLTSGAFVCSTEPDSFVIEDGGNPIDSDPPEPCGDVRILMTNNADVEGYVTAVCHNPATLRLDAILPGAAFVEGGGDFFAEEIFADGGTLGAVLDLMSPFEGNIIPPGSDRHIATYSYCCRTLPSPGSPPVETPLTFCDGRLGTPAKDNLVVVGGRSFGAPQGLVLTGGTFTCNPPREVERPEICDNLVDDDEDGLTDLEDPECQTMFACGSRVLGPNGLPLPLEGSVGGDVEVCFFLKSPEDNIVGHPQTDHIQGFTMAVTFCCELVADDHFDVSGTIVEAIGAEFVTAAADNNPDDGDLCELIIGVLVDAVPPFDGDTIPPLPDLQRVGCVRFSVKETAVCGSCCPIEFTDKINGPFLVPVSNLVSVENNSRSPQLMDCEVCIVGPERFFRGDCNFSDMGSMSVDVADAAAVISFLFLPGTWKFEPPCLDACDCNDDGRIDLADALCVLQYYLQNGRFPPPPGPGLELTGMPNPNMVRETPPGVDPTADKLDCDGGRGCPTP